MISARPTLHRPIALTTAILLVAGLPLGCGQGRLDAPTASLPGAVTPATSRERELPSVASAAISRQPGDAVPGRDAACLPVVAIETSLGVIKVRLHDDRTPRTADNFLRNYVDRGYYSGTVFHHVEKGFMVAAGGYTSDLQPKPTRAWIRNESAHGLSNRRGTVAMAHHPDYPHSATSQFFINLVDNPSLDYRLPGTGEVTEEAYGYCVFGEVIAGLDVVDKIAEQPVRGTEFFPCAPAEPVYIKSIRRVP